MGLSFQSVDPSLKATNPVTFPQTVDKGMVGSVTFYLTGVSVNPSASISIEGSGAPVDSPVEIILDTNEVTRTIAVTN